MTSKLQHLPDESALKHLGTLVLAGTEADRRVDPHASGADFNHVPAIITRFDEKVEKIDHLLLHRQRYRGAYSTRLAEGFVAYTKGMLGAQAPRVFVDDAKMQAVAFMNAGDVLQAGHCDHTATCTLRETALFTSLKLINGRKHTQKDLAEYLEDWHAYWMAPDTGNSNPIRQQTAENPYPDYSGTSLPRAIQAIRSMKKVENAELTSKVVAMGGTLTGMAATQVTSEFAFPEMLVAHGQLYPDLPAQFVGVRLSVIWTDDEPKIVPRIVALEQLTEKLAALFVQRLTADLAGTNAIVMIGAFDPK